MFTVQFDTSHKISNFCDCFPGLQYYSKIEMKQIQFIKRNGYKKTVSTLGVVHELQTDIS